MNRAMKNHILSLFLLLTVVPFADLRAEEIEPMLTEGKVWVRKDDYGPNGREPRYFTIKVERDTILQGKACKVISFYENGVKQNTGATRDQILCEENGSIDWWSRRCLDDKDKFHPIIDMSFRTDDFIETWDYAGPSFPYLQVDKAFTIELFGHKRKCISVKYVNDYPLNDPEGGHDAKYSGGYWIEGIGCTDNTCLIRPIEFFLPKGYNDSYPFPELYQCYDGDELIYTQEEFKKALIEAGIK